MVLGSSGVTVSPWVCCSCRGQAGQLEAGVGCLFTRERHSRGQYILEQHYYAAQKKIMTGHSPGHMVVHTWRYTLPTSCGRVCRWRGRGGGGRGIPIRLKITLTHCAVEALVMLRPKVRYELGARIRGRSRRGLGEREAEAAVAAVRHAPGVHLGNRD